MVFSSQQPASTNYTAPRVATGFDALQMAIMGKNADGTDNEWGKAVGWIPGVGVAQQYGASKLAKSAGLTDIQQTVDDGMDNRLAKLKAGMGVAQAIYGGVTANPVAVADGLSAAIGGVGAGLGADAQDEAVTNQRLRQQGISRSQFQ